MAYILCRGTARAGRRGGETRNYCLNPKPLAIRRFAKTPRLKCTKAADTVDRDLPEKADALRVRAAARGPAFALKLGSSY
jgi:hypothetical protein